MEDTSGAKALVSVNNFHTVQAAINSPRTLEACLRSGFDPKELYPRPFEDFMATNSGNKDVAKLKAKHFEKRRNEKVKAVKDERDIIMRYLEQQQAAPVDTTGVSSIDLIKSQREKETSSMMAMERNRLKRLKERQQKEIEQILASEEKTARIQKENLVKEKREMERREEMEKLKAKRREEVAAKKREKLLKKAKLEEEEEAARKKLASDEAARERAIADEEKRQTKIRMREARMRDEERKMKGEQHRQEIEEMLKAQEELDHQARLRMEERERVVAEVITHKKEAHKRRLQVKRSKAEQRIQAALEAGQNVLKKRKNDFDEKQRLAHVRAAEHKAKADEELRKQADKREKEHMLAVQRKRQSEKLEDDRIGDILGKRSKQDQFLDRVYKEREEKRQIKKAMQEIQKDDKLSNVQRIKRIDEFVRLQTLQKIQDDDDRSERIKSEKDNLIRQRKQAQLDALMRKHNINSAMEKMRVSNNWGSMKDLHGKKKKKKKKGGVSESTSLPAL